VNIPSIDIIKETDYCGLYSGADRDKSSDCNFDIYYGILKTAPLIAECPVNIECSVFQSYELPSHELVVGKITEIHIADSCLSDGEPDVHKINPFLWIARPMDEYWSFGEYLGKAYNIGRVLEK
jgi:flavin reductase (DIM6/NTAB) family NADH-FMN oxidoreductase RutF